MKKTSMDLGFQHFCENAPDFFPNNSSSYVASFVVYRENKKMYAVPKDPEQLSLFSHILPVKHTAKVKEDGTTVTIRFEMPSIAKLTKTKDGGEVMTMAPVEGSEDLFNASSLICIRRSAKGITMERQIAFECDTKFVPRTDVCQYLDDPNLSDR